MTAVVSEAQQNMTGSSASLSNDEYIQVLQIYCYKIMLSSTCNVLCKFFYTTTTKLMLCIQVDLKHSHFQFVMLYGVSRTRDD